MSPQINDRFSARPNRRTRSVLAVVGLGVAVASCGTTTTEDDTTRDDSGDVVEGGDVGSLSLKVGDCLADDAVGEVESVPVVPCSEPHSAELFHSFLISGDEYPGDSEVRAITSDTCIAEFENFIGLPEEDSVWTVTGIFPTEATWNQVDDREVICGVFRVDREAATGSARGIGE